LFIGPQSNFIWYYTCCGSLFADCCFRLQTWVIVTLAVIGILALGAIVISLIRCIFCCD
uniref:Caveolin n=1 Tax=Syphacia muris TaxID=451379 RepID=A0A0N5AUH1_9BILA